MPAKARRRRYHPGVVVRPEPPGPVLGSGRDADVYALDTHRVLRRYRPLPAPDAVDRWSPHDSRPEADLMNFLADAGYPAPRVYEADGPDMVMHRLYGPTMLADLARHPWRVVRHARTLARLHQRLHAIDPPGWLPGATPGAIPSTDPPESARILHMDLHPANVLLTGEGPVVIDWTDAAVGAPGRDVAETVVVLRTSDVDLALWRRLLLRALRLLYVWLFRGYATADPAPYLVAQARARMANPQVRPSELRRLHRFVGATRTR